MCCRLSRWEALALGAGCEQQFRGAKAGDVSLRSVTTGHGAAQAEGRTAQRPGPGGAGVVWVSPGPVAAGKSVTA